MTGEHEIELFSGTFLDLADPRPESISALDVAVGLSRENRYAGQSLEPYSVAEHALLVADRVASLGMSARLEAAALHHDDAEAFVKDVPAPLKSMLQGYDEVESRVRAAVLQALGVSGLPVDAPEVKDADLWARAQEAGELLPSAGRGWRSLVRGGYEWDGQRRGLGGRDAGEVAYEWLLRSRDLTARMEVGEC